MSAATAALHHLASALPGYEPRAGQAEMAEAVATAIAAETDLVVEAGTGTGKTLAYLVAALISRRRVLISTATKQLQSQIVEHDLPAAQLACGVSPKVAVLKGRSNYLCLHRLQQAVFGRQQAGASVPADLARIHAFAFASADGDRAAIEGVDVASPLWAEATSTTDNCLGQACPQIGSCFVALARRRAAEAEVVIVNHHLLLADYAVRERWQHAGLLPSAGVVVVDEAHTLAETATAFFGNTLTSRRFATLIEDARALLRQNPALPSIDPLVISADLTNALLASLQGVEQAAAALWAWVDQRPHLAQLHAAELQVLRPLRVPLDAALGRLQGLAGDAELAADPAWAKASETVFALRLDLEACLPTENSQDGNARWIEARGRDSALVCRPVDVAPVLKKTLLAENAVRIFTSATLAVGGGFSLTLRHLGLAATTTSLCLASPFDFARQACLYIPESMPLPFAAGREAAVAQTVCDLAMAAAGGTLALFSSNRALQDAADRLRTALPFAVLVQGDESKERLLQRFVDSQPALLLATLGFWHGVDLPAEALRAVVLDKIPFPPPDEPLLQARAARLEAEGRSAFDELSLAAAEQTLRQGFGRLIRSHLHRGVVALLDPRLLQKSYGRKLLRALPPARQVHTFAEVVAFLTEA